MKVLSIIGHFAFGKNYLDGQTIKTKIMTDELELQLGKEQVVKFDTHGKYKTLLKAPFQVIKALKRSKNVLIFPAHNGLRVFAPLLSFFKKFFKGRRLHYSVIGGWLPELLKHKKRLIKSLNRFDGIYVETNTMKNAIEELGVKNVYVVPNCKKLHVLSNEELIYPSSMPYKLCTFSRVMREKGIEDALNAVTFINKKYGKVILTLDIYGQVDSAQEEWFELLQKDFPEYIRYCGVVDYDNSTNVIKDYCALLFPTHYDGEGFAGTLIDAMAAGVPVITSDWKYNSDIVKDGKTGFIYCTHNQEELVAKIELMIERQTVWCDMKSNCLKEAMKYLPEKVIGIIVEKL